MYGAVLLVDLNGLDAVEYLLRARRVSHDAKEANNVAQGRRNQTFLSCQSAL